MTPDRIHDALPWFVNGTLEPEEAAAFEEHLMDCADCKKELTFLEKLKAELERHGDDFLAEHPTPEKLLGLLEPEAADESLGEEEITSLQRHLALCATCAEEARWLRGEASAGSSHVAYPDRASKEWIWRWSAVAAMLLLALTTTLWLREGPGPLGPGVIRPSLVEETGRALPGPTKVAVPSGSTHVFLIFPVDLASDALPVTLKILDEQGRSRYREQIVAGDLVDGLYLYVGIPRRELPDGDYRARMAGSPDAARPGLEFSFRVAGAPAR
jgi:hypothetical protein